MTNKQTQLSSTSGASQDAPAISLKLCTSCFAKLPTSHFALNKYYVDNLHINCQLCHAQYYRLDRKVKYNAKSTKDDSIIRCIRIQNTNVIKLALDQSTFSCIAFIPYSPKIYTVTFGPSATIASHLSMSIVLKDTGDSIGEFAFKDSVDRDSLVQALIGILKSFNLRLELSDMDMTNSITTIYYI